MIEQEVQEPTIIDVTAETPETNRTATPAVSDTHVTPATPATGDESHMTLWGLLAGAAIVLLTASLSWRRKENRKHSR